MITEEQYLKLKNFERPLLTTKRAGYAHISPADFRKMLRIYYGEDYEKKVPKNVFSCSYCKLQCMTEIAIDYFKYERQLNTDSSTAQ